MGAVQAQAAQFNMHFAFLLTNGLNAIATEVEHGLPNLRGVSQHPRGVGIQRHGQSHVRGQAHLDKPHVLQHQFIELHGLAVGRFIAAEGQNLPHQVARSSACLVNFVQAHLGQRLRACILLGQAHITQNRAQDVVEVMGNTTGHGADRLHFLRFAQLVFHGFAGGQVAGKYGGDVAF